MRRPVSLVSYSSSDENDSENSASVAPRKKRLPELPSSLTPHIPLDSPALHQGRIRTTPHVEGQFAAYVYVPLILDARSPLRKVVKQSYAYAKTVIPSLHPIGEQNFDSPAEKSSEARVSKLEHGDGGLELHISLTRPTYLRAHQREDLKRAVKAIAQCNQTFNASFASFSELINDERTRTFLTAEIGAGHQELKALSDALVPTLLAIKQQEFYSKPRFHISIAWALLDHPRTIEKDRNFSSSTPTSPPSSRQLSPGISNQVSEEEETSNSNKPSQPSPPQTSCSHRFPTIPSLPASLLSDLNRMFGSSLSSRHIGMFEVREIVIRIGKEVSRWPLAG
ncbi:uncharacterized protein LAESUDRAFT_801703 [Laetiporus sulphureus 93-53]|uniref:U6 snRNA phosphodiesterase 1 n=1 Tax=Laetiporus sulphureus 93-53 TaxID=1314785 RepID=A0A165FK55_9APHY|nr:uncharacterized protein LAESUDRAFT_801703 [Laetiporus sulphureus 93-53]KZT09095.1 hypothetical protein LAESUDRAFT_801703 [Laetiporus sulphureus 93-53]